MKETNQKVTKLSNEYTKQSDQNKKIKHLEQQVVRRRMKVFVPLLALPIIFISFTAFAQHQQNQELADELASTEQTLEDATAKEEQLLKQIERLNDDNYIARMARSEFYLSEEGEIIFNLLEDEE
ncbi:FtsB family cell division protein [Aliicoccus persicus]|uniref:Cell division protein DivIC n=1 Tax=Aliicoccus persicus TaxID=930138 RepID=A0A662Z7B8_9STAP|nr:septum formation initiator family protein [Aliicoccus persicus]SEW06020.1 cell division protein DivIC [Aliicoccus persicus]HJE18851.1 septum formation initiator family protein [Aliicoccus persicus]